MQVGSFGFPEQQRSKVEKILRLSRRRDYELVAFDETALPDVLLVFGEEALSAPSVSALPADYRRRLVVVSRQKPKEVSLPHIGYPLISSRVIRVLDGIVDRTIDSVPLTDSDAPLAADVSENKKVALSDESRTQETEPDDNALRVLVVDDSAPMRQALADQLMALPMAMQISFAEDGASALSVTDQQHFDLIFLDIMMPGIDGFETCTQLRQKAHIKKTPIIMLSSKTSPLDEVKGIMAGCSTYLTKPIVPDEFQKVIRRVSKWITEYRPERAASQARTN
ncbi:response regulator [Neptunomonas phycophila]|jgi:two-component system cell cycle response regulator|uniref:Response regulator n=1 Tax=Neptunomonas phycophila TaxID=1572645 RepID=A0ABT9ETX5_9GAMM|nr:response regulator [Neptunomonas phycophila]MDP2522533.1 response regulator [Neptunomonas phycophila]QLE99162.1 response regulator [Neptunomonas phycophila]